MKMRSSMLYRATTLQYADYVRSSRALHNIELQHSKPLLYKQPCAKWDTEVLPKLGKRSAPENSMALTFRAEIQTEYDLGKQLDE